MPIVIAQSETTNASLLKPQTNMKAPNMSYFQPAINGIRNWVIWVSVVLVVLGMSSNAALAQDSTLPPEQVDIIILVDSSPSTQGGEGTDPQNSRIEAARLLLGYFEAIAKINNMNIRAGVANFGIDIDLGTATSLSPIEGLVRDGINISTDQILGTDFRPALEYAREQLITADGAQSVDARAVFVLTDGDPGLFAKMTDEQKIRYFNGEKIDGDRYDGRNMRDLLADLKHRKIAVYVHSVDEKNSNLWKNAIGADHYHPLVADDLASAFLPIASQITGLDIGQAFEVTEDNPQEIKPGLCPQTTVLSVLKERPDVQVRLTDTLSQTDLKPEAGGEQNDYYEVFVIDQPNGGPWRVSTEGGKAEVWRSFLPPKLELEEIPASQVVGMATTLTATLTCNGLDYIMNQGLQLQGVMTGPNNYEYDISLVRPTDKGLYQIPLGNLEKIGSYLVTITGTLEGEDVTLQGDPIQINVFPVPVIKEFTVEGELYRGNTVTITAEIADSDRLPAGQSIQLDIVDQQGKVLEQLNLRDDGVKPDLQSQDSIFTSVVVLKQDLTSQRVIAVLRGISRDRLPYVSLYEWQVEQTVAPNPVTTPTSEPKENPTPPPNLTDILKDILVTALMVLVAAIIAMVMWRGLRWWKSRRIKWEHTMPDRSTRTPPTNLDTVIRCVNQINDYTWITKRIRPIGRVINVDKRIIDCTANAKEVLNELIKDNRLKGELERSINSNDLDSLLTFSRSNRPNLWWPVMKEMGTCRNQFCVTAATREFRECMEKAVFSSPFELLAEAGENGMATIFCQQWNSSSVQGNTTS